MDIAKETMKPDSKMIRPRKRPRPWEAEKSDNNKPVQEMPGLRKQLQDTEATGNMHMFKFAGAADNKHLKQAMERRKTESNMLQSIGETMEMMEGNTSDQIEDMEMEDLEEVQAHHEVNFKECPICYREFTDNEADTIPRIMSCSHTVCTRCLEERIENGIIRCPYDQKLTFIDQASNLPKNWVVLSKDWN